MDHDRSTLSAYELEVLAEVEASLRQDAPDLARSLTGSFRGRALRRAMSQTWAAAFAAVGSVLFAAWCVVGHAAIGLGAFVLVLAAVHHWVGEWQGADAGQRMRRVLGIEPVPPEPGRQGRAPRGPDGVEM